ncbi:MAG: hypothetical protein J6M12_09140 [Clostridia bacterium]|nr:hypothetical protein [Clostridia bacterium]
MAKNDTIFPKPVDNSVETVEGSCENSVFTGLSVGRTRTRLWKSLWKLWRTLLAKFYKMKSVKLHNSQKSKRQVAQNHRPKREKQEGAQSAFLGKIPKKRVKKKEGKSH